MKRERRTMEVQLGERGLVEFTNAEGIAEVVDFMFMPVSPFLEIPG